MFVKIENYYDNSKALLLNIDNIICVEARRKLIPTKDDINTLEQEYDGYRISCLNNIAFHINETQYEELCRALNRVSK